MKHLPIRPALISLLALCAMVTLGVAACGSVELPADGAAPPAAMPADVAPPAAR
jgi:hypothetical protein